MASLFVDGSQQVEALGIFRSLSHVDLLGTGTDAPQGPPGEAPEAEADKEALQLGAEKEETESSDDNTTQYSIHPPFDFPYFLLLQGYNHRQVRGTGDGLDGGQRCTLLKGGGRGLPSKCCLEWWR